MAPVIALLNHLLAQEPWSCRQLALHAGKTACIDTGAFALRLRVSADGMFEAARDAAAASTVTIRVKLSDLPLIMQNRQRAFSYVRIDGDAEFANAISQLSKTLRWDAEHDLEKVLGPILAARIGAGARTVLQAGQSGGQKLAENLAEFFLEEQPVLVHVAAGEEFSAGVTRLRDDVERAAKRIEKIERRLGNMAPIKATGIPVQ